MFRRLLSGEPRFVLSSAITAPRWTGASPSMRRCRSTVANHRARRARGLAPAAGSACGRAAHARDGQDLRSRRARPTIGTMNDLSAFPITRKWPAAPSRPPPALFAADAERRQGVDHARGDRPAVRAAPGRFDTQRPACRPSSCRSTRTTRSRRSSIPNGPGGKPLALFESGAILLYLADKTGKLVPADPARPLRDDPVADVPDGRHRADVRPGRLLPQIRRQGLRGQAAARSLRRRGEAPARRARAPARRAAPGSWATTTRSPTSRSSRGCATWSASTAPASWSASTRIRT